MKIYITDINEHGELWYSTPGAPGDYSLETIAKFNGMDDFYFNDDSQEYETELRIYKYWENQFLNLERVNSELSELREEHGDLVLNAIVDRAAEYENVEERCECLSDWLERLPWLSTQHVTSKDKINKIIAYEDELAVMHLDDSEWLDSYIGMGDNEEQAKVDYIRKSLDN